MTIIAQNEQLSSPTEPYHYHNEQRRGSVSFLVRPVEGGKPKQHTFPLAYLPQALRQYTGVPNSYICQSESFSAWSRRLIYLRNIQCCYVDLDTYTVDPMLTAGELVRRVQEICTAAKLPLPSSIMTSGRGYYLKWYLTGPLPAAALPRWRAVQQRLTTPFLTLGADKKVITDAVRVLRLEGTINPKSGTRVAVLSDAVPLVAYDFDILADAVLPYRRPDRQQQAESEQDTPPLALAAAPRVRRPGAALHCWSAGSLWWARIGDLRRLVKLRLWQHIPAGQQDAFLFVFACAMFWQTNHEQAYYEAQAFARELLPPGTWTGDQVRGVLATAYSRAKLAAAGRTIEWQGKPIDARYRMSNAYLIDTLNITAAEQRELSTIIDTTERRRRRGRVRTAAEYHAAISAAAASRRAAVAELSAAGLPPAEIAQRLGMARFSVQRLLWDKQPDYIST